MYGFVPEAFSQVVLSDRRTWHRATFREWLDLRRELLEREKQQQELRHLDREKLHAQFEAYRILNKEMDVLGDSPRPPKGGDIEKRRRILIDKLFYSKHPEYQPLTEWEREFLDVSAWMEKAYEAYAKHRGLPDPLAILFEWLITIEDNLGLAQRREAEREKAFRSVSKKSRRSRRRINQYYPRPIELIYIYKSAMTIIHNIKDRFQTYIAYGDPIPGTQSKLDLKLNDFLRDNRHNDLTIRFTHQLKSYGYIPFQEEEACIQWDHWKEVIAKLTPAQAARKYLAFLFKVSESTIKRDLSRSTLKRMYNEYEVKEGYRRYLDGKGTVESAFFYKQGWYLRLENGEPSRFDWGITYYPQDHSFEIRQDGK